MTLTNHILSQDTQAILLLCGVFGKHDRESVPLKPSEFTRLARKLYDSHLRPADLLTQPGRQFLELEAASFPEAAAALPLLERGAALALLLESWTNQGLWIISRADSHYPRRLRDKGLHVYAPLLYGVGEPAHLEQGGLAVIGSRNADEQAIGFTSTIGLTCAAHRIPIISGGARGVDKVAMESALEHGGSVVGVLADNLGRTALTKQYRLAIQNGMLTLVSPYHPEAAFSIGAAMGRNKLIYGLSTAALVVSSDAEKGGTWSGAIENLKQHWVPLLVRTGPDTPNGNEKLVEAGGIPVASDAETVEQKLIATLESLAEVAGPLKQESPEIQDPNPRQLRLF